LYKAYQAEQVLLTEDMKAQRRKEIEDKEKSAKELQKQKFGYQGELFLKDRN
jgi:outer membrane protein